MFSTFNAHRGDVYCESRIPRPARPECFAKQNVSKDGDVIPLIKTFNQKASIERYEEVILYSSFDTPVSPMARRALRTSGMERLNIALR